MIRNQRPDIRTGRQLQRGAVVISLAALCFILLSTGCSRGYVITDRGPQAYYQTGYPVQDTSRELERIFRSVKRINVTGHYNTYIFPLESRITIEDIKHTNLLRQTDDFMSFTNSKAGTAIVVSTAGTQLALITNDHVIDFPDTVIQYYKVPGEGRERTTTPYIEQISIKTLQINLIYDMPHLGPFELIARDRRNDLALIGVKYVERDLPIRPPPVRVSVGDPSRLSWGSFVYILGYPKGFKMVTRAIVSDPNRDRRASFILDGLFNEGISGGLILAVRGETGELEWVGMAQGGSASTEMILTPPEVEMDDIDFLRPYRDDIYVNPVQRIEYGITYSVSMRTIQRFLRDQHSTLQHEGYSFSRYLISN